MTAQQLHLVAPTGARVDIELPADAPVSSVVAGIRFAGGSFGSGFQIGPRGYHEFACTTVAPAVPRDRFLVHGREVVVAEAVDQESSVATLIGTYHELMTVYAGRRPPGSGCAPCSPRCTWWTTSAGWSSGPGRRRWRTP